MSAEPEKDAPVAKGLKGVLAADSSICLVDGTEGRLLYRGYDIDELAQRSTFEEVAYLLLKGELPTRAQYDEFWQALGAHRKLPEPVHEFLRSLPRDVPPMTALRSAVSLAGVYDPQAEDDSPEANFQKAIRLTAMLPTLVARIHRHRAGLIPAGSGSELGLAGNFLWMLTARWPTEDEIKAMDLILILHAEHSFNASTFAARVIAATLSDMYSAVTGAVGALKGKLHGGANTEVLRTLQKIDSVDQIAPWVADMRAKKGTFMGFGHAVYKTEDPRVKYLKELSRLLAEKAGFRKWHNMSVEMERLVRQAINKPCNVDFYSASVQYYLGIPGEMFTCVFAASRIVGWCAHVLEQLSDNKIIRPSANYTGSERRPYVEIEKR